MASPGIEAQLAAILARMAGIERQGEATAQDVREARDGVTRLTAVQSEQRVGERLETLRSAIDHNAAEARQDLVNAADRLASKILAVDEKVDTMADVLKVDYTDLNTKMGVRVAALEKLATKGEGANALLQWAIKVGPWLLGTAAVALGVKDNLGK
jgi:hypothetical protein